MRYHAVLFDLDGTLLNTLQDLAGSMNTVLEERGFPTHALDRYKIFVGEGVENLVTRTLPEGEREHGTVAACVRAMQEEYGRRWADTTLPYPGIPELLDALEDAGLRCTILSNKPDDMTKLTVARLLAGHRFDVVAGACANVPRKPDPAGAFRVCDKLNIPPEQFLYVGDTNTDMQTATAAGMFAVGVLWGFRTAAELLDNGARQLAEHPRDILALATQDG